MRKTLKQFLLPEGEGGIDLMFFDLSPYLFHPATVRVNI